MYSKLLIFILFVVTHIYACRPIDQPLYEFNPAKLTENEITLLEIAEDVSYIPLDNLITLNKIFPVKIGKDAIYLNSTDIGILRFNLEGKFVAKIGGVGRGPGEYLMSGRFCIDDRLERIYVSDKGVIKVFSGRGQFIRSFSLKESGDVIGNIEFYNSGIFVQYSIQFRNADNEWIICDTLGNVMKKQHRHLPEFTTNWGTSTPIYKFEDRLSYYNAFADTVFSVLPDLTEIPSFTIATGEYRHPRSNLSVEQFLSGKYLNITNIFETKLFFVIVYNYNKKHYLALIDKHNQEPFLIRFEYGDSGRSVSGGIVNDLDGGTWFFPKSYFSEGGREYLVGLQEPYQIKAWVESDEFRNSVPKYPEKKKEFERLANSLKETDNPVLMMVRLKQ